LQFQTHSCGTSPKVSNIQDFFSIKSNNFAKK